MPVKAIAAAAAEARERRDQENQAQVDDAIAEFGGDTDAAGALTRMAEEILYWRRRIKWISAVVRKVETEEPFAIINAGPHWEPGKRERGWWR
jgi:hypothetical protein